MADPTPERIAAALRLAQTVDSWFHAGGVGVQLPPWIAPTLSAYRATAPKLRTRAEVDAEIVARIRAIHGRMVIERGSPLEEALTRLCAEPLAPDPTSEPNRVTDHDADQRPHPYGPSSVDSSSPSEPAAGATLSDVEACGCEESDALKDAVNEAAKLLDAIHEAAKTIVDLSRRVP